MFLKKLFQLMPSDPFSRGLDHFNRGELAQAVECFSPLLDDPDEGVRNKARLYCCEAHLQLGDRYSDADGRRALGHYELARELQPDFADIHYKAGMLYLRAAERLEAEEAFRQALDINPRYFSAHLALCEVLLRDERVEEAEQELERLLENAPALFRDKISELLQACRSRALSGCVGLVSSIRELSPSRREVMRQSALDALHAGQPARAVEALQEVLRETDRYPDLHHLMGLAYAGMEQHDEAIAAFERALAIHPGYRKARINLALAFLELERFAEAREQLQWVLDREPNHPLALSAMQEIQSLVGN